jgi:hypothetical protein
MRAKYGPVGGKLTAVTCNEHRVRQLASLPETVHFLGGCFNFRPSSSFCLNVCIKKIKTLGKNTSSIMEKSKWRVKS